MEKAFLLSLTHCCCCKKKLYMIKRLWQEQASVCVKIGTRIWQAEFSHVIFFFARHTCIYMALNMVGLNDDNRWKKISRFFTIHQQRWWWWRRRQQRKKYILKNNLTTPTIYVWDFSRTYKYICATPHGFRGSKNVVKINFSPVTLCAKWMLRMENEIFMCDICTAYTHIHTPARTYHTRTRERRRWWKVW